MKKVFINLLLFSILIIVFIYLFVNGDSEIFGRKIWYKSKKIFDFSLDGKETSQQLIDIYSLSHITHGIVFMLIFTNMGFNNYKSLLLSLTLEFIWEYFENTNYIIKNYRKNKEYENYKGDSIINTIGDMLFTILGCYLFIYYYKFSLFYSVSSEILLMPFSANVTKQILLLYKNR